MFNLNVVKFNLANIQESGYRHYDYQFIVTLLLKCWERTTSRRFAIPGSLYLCICNEVKPILLNLLSP